MLKPGFEGFNAGNGVESSEDENLIKAEQAIKRVIERNINAFAGVENI